MGTVRDIRALLADHREELKKTYKVRSIGVFGSYVRGEQKKKSDVDILVEFDEIPSLLRFMELEQHLKNLLGTRVDLVTKEALKPHIGKRILEEVQYL
jgi:predicted nucleotidyltransferase